MQTQYCPECNTELTRSIVGYLCHGCGGVHGFEKMGTSMVSASAPSNPKPKPNVPSHSKFARHQPDMHASVSPKPSKMRHHVKKFVVPQVAEINALESMPELPAPSEQDHNLPGLPAETVPAVAAVLPAIEPDAPSATRHSFNGPIAQESFRDTETDNDALLAEEPNKVSSYIVPALAGILVLAALVVAYIIIF